MPVLLNKDGKKMVDVCQKCSNYGYYQIGFKGSDEAMQMFCACPIGKELSKLTAKWRIEDIKRVVDRLIPKLEDIKAKLIKPDEAGKLLVEVIDELNGLQKKSNEALKK